MCHLLLAFHRMEYGLHKKKKKNEEQKKILRDEKLSGFPRGTVGGYTLLSSIEVRHIL